MTYPTLLFSLVFLPVSVIGFQLFSFPKVAKWSLLVSVVFLFTFNPWILLSCLLFSLMAYIGVKYKLLYTASVIIQAVMLIISRMLITFDYKNILPTHLFFLSAALGTIPLAVCAMNNIGYILDVKNDRCKKARSFLGYLTYVLFLPPLFTGPYFTFEEFRENQLKQTKNIAFFAKGMKYYLKGLGKTVLLSGSMIALWSELSTIGAEKLTPLTALFGLFALAFSVYYITTGMNDMSIGIGGMYGFEMMRNYDHPFVSKGFIDFLKRFNITVWNWTQKYLIIESEINTHIMYLLLWITLMLFFGSSTSLLMWGILFGVAASAEYYLLDLRKLHKRDVVNFLYGMPGIFFGFLFFGFFDLGSLASYIGALFHIPKNDPVQAAYLVTRYLIPMVLCGVFSLDYSGLPWGRLKGKAAKIFGESVQILLLAGLFLLSVGALIDKNSNPFLLLGVWKL